MKNLFFTILITLHSLLIADDKVSFSIGNSSQRVNDLEFIYEEDGKGYVIFKIDQVSSRLNDFQLDIKDPNYIDYVKWFTKLSNADMRGFSFNVKSFKENIDLKLDVDRVLFEIKDIDIAFDTNGDDFQLNSFDFKYVLSNLEFFAPFINDQVDDELEIVNRLVPDGKLSKVDLSASYSKTDNILKIAGSLRMLSGSGILNIDIVVNENSVDLTYVKNFSLKLNNLAEGFIEYIDKIDESTSLTVKRLGRGSFELKYSGPINEIGSKKDIESSYASEARTAMSNIYNAAKMYYQTRGQWPTYVEELERAGQLDLNRSTKLKWIFEIQLPDKIIATSTAEMKGGSSKIVIFDASIGKFYGYGSDEGSDISNYSSKTNTGNNSIVCISTDFGLIEVELLPNLAPKHVESFLNHVKNGYYDGTTFHRIIPGFMIQGGDPLTRNNDRSRHGTGGNASKYFGIGQETNYSTWSIPAEFNSTPHERGIMSMARSQNPNSAGSQFFIVVNDAKYLDNQYTVFGRVLRGMDIADLIVAQPRDARDNPEQRIEMNIYICD